MILLSNNNTIIPKKFSPLNIRFYQDCQCIKCSPNLYGNISTNQKKTDNNESFKSAEDFHSFHSGMKDSSSSNESIAQDQERQKARKELFEQMKLGLVRKIILMIELNEIECKVNIFDKVICNMDKVILQLKNFLFFFESHL